MTRPDTQALYVMQNEFGLIKIGRSLNPERRRRGLQSGEGCAIVVVTVLDGQGHREEQIHLGLKRHAIEGEWFEGTPSARVEIANALPELAGCEWPFDYDPRGAKAWLDDFFGRRDQRAVERQFSRMLTVHLLAYDAGRSADEMIRAMLRLLDAYEMPAMGSEPLVRPIRRKELPTPPYTTDLPAALSLWPTGARPAQWEGTAYDCAVAAMRERYAKLRSGPVA